ncbi:hypothetical protein ABH926_007396 [Catenulispora sp. GP43]
MNPLLEVGLCKGALMSREYPVNAAVTYPVVRPNGRQELCSTRFRRSRMTLPMTSGPVPNTIFWLSPLG